MVDTCHYTFVKIHRMSGEFQNIYFLLVLNVVYRTFPFSNCPYNFVVSIINVVGNLTTCFFTSQKGSQSFHQLTVLNVG